MSNLLEIYKKSIFADIGKKVSIMSNKNIPDDIDIGEFKSNSILDLQSDFFEKVVLPFGTILENQSDFGDIIVNPTESIINLFSTLNNDVGLIQISADSNLLKLDSLYDDIRDANATDLLLHTDFPILDVTDETSVLSFSTVDVNLFQTPLLENSDILETTPFETISVLNSSFVDVVNLETDSVLSFNSDFDNIIEFKTTSVLNSDSTFAEVVELPYSDVLNSNSNFDDLVIKNIGSVLKIYMASNLPGTTPGVVNFFDDVYASGFTPNAVGGQSLYNFDIIVPYIGMEVTPEKEIGNIKLMPDTPIKEIGSIQLMPDALIKDIVEPIPILDPIDKPISDINPPAVTLEKIIPNLFEIRDTPDKINFISDDTEFPNRYFLGEVVGNIPNTGLVNFIPDVKAYGFTREALRLDTQFILDGTEVPYEDRILFTNDTIPSDWGQLGAVNFIVDEHAFGFTLGALPGITQFRLSLTTNTEGELIGILPLRDDQKIGAVNFFPDDKATGFTLGALPGVTDFNLSLTPDNDGGLIGILPLRDDQKIGAVNFFPDDKATGFTVDGRGLITEYNLELAPDLNAFDFNDASYGGVLNQFAVYFSKYPPLTNVTYKTVIDWAYNRTIRIPNAQTLFNEGFHTPTLPIGQTQLVTPPYDYATDRLPTWANPFVDTLADVGSTLVSGFLSQRTIEILDTFTDLDLLPWKESPVIFHQLAGELYWQYSDLGTVVRNVREATINFASNLVGRTLAEYFIPKVESSITGGTAALINSMLSAPLLDGEKVLMMYHIFMGTKYTKSKAFFDRMTKTYSSKYGQTGDNAINLYNDSSIYSRYASADSVGTIQTLVPDSVNSVITGIKQTLTSNGILSSFFPILSLIGTVEEDNSLSPLKSKLLQTLAGTKNTKIPVGDYEPGLINEYITRANSKTFGTITDPEAYYSVDTTLERRTYKYDGTPLSGSININHPTEEELERSDSLRVQSDLNALNGLTLAEYNVASLTDFSMVYRVSSPGHNSKAETYNGMLEDRLKLTDKAKLLVNRGFPSVHSRFADTKNRLNMIKMPEAIENDLGTQEYTDTDLINFYFEDLSSLSDTNESVVIPFRAIITTISDGTSANWSAQEYMGRADKFWIYQGFDRRVAINFEVALNSKSEFVSSWNKINYLQGMCYPVEYPAEIALKAPIMALTVGNLFDRIQVIMNSISYTFDSSTIWETQQGFQLPMYIKIAVDFTVIYADTPKASAKHIAQNQGWVEPALFDYNEDGAQSEENQNLIITNEDGSIGTVRKSSNDELTKALPASTPVT